MPLLMVTLIGWLGRRAATGAVGHAVGIDDSGTGARGHCEHQS
jgi:hypothetical protein